MTAQPHEPPRAPLLAAPEKTPRGVRDALLAEDVVEFDRDFRAAMAEAAETFDLAPVNACVERWWPVAWSSTDPEGHRRMLEQAGRLLRGESVPTTPWEHLKSRLVQ